MRKVELLPTRDCEAGYGPDNVVFKMYVLYQNTVELVSKSL